MSTSESDNLKKLIVEKSCLKQDVFAVTKESFELLSDVLSSLSKDLESFIKPTDSRVEVKYDKVGIYEQRLTLGGDTVIFHMHSNVFTFPNTHLIQKNSYVRADQSNAFVGVINIYNFLTDSFRYHRLNDSGYLVGRIFINKDRHFFVEGKRRLGFLFNDFANSQLDKESLNAIVITALNYVLEFDLFTPPLDMVSEVSMREIEQLSQNMSLRTGKRLGFKFQRDDDYSIEF